jgi:hypothetical protein
MYAILRISGKDITKLGFAESTGLLIIPPLRALTGRTTATLSPAASITRAEVAVIVERLLHESGLI